MSAPTIADQGVDHAADVTAITQVIADIERGFNSNDAELLVEHFAENASAVTATGTQVDGRVQHLPS
ncbi:MAG: hypothetical protein ACRDRZ_02130 [Pseudonocardiaceae bacterium]